MSFLTRLPLAIGLALILQSKGFAQNADLTITLTGEIAELGGAVTVYTIPRPNVETTPQNVVISDRYAQIQFRFPANATFAYRFALEDGVEGSGLSQTLTIIGTDNKDQGARMTAGFTDSYSNGGRTIRILPAEERLPDAWPNWGETQGYAAKPPADIASARALAGVFDPFYSDPITLACKGNELVQVCTPRLEDAQKIELRWWRSIAEGRLERLRHHALRKCYDNRSAFATGNCQPVKGSDEPEYE